jgi:hypothetical protein
MITMGQRDKERAVCEKVAYYVEHGFKKSEAVRKTMVDFCYTTEASIYNILRRNKKTNAND